VKAEGPDQDGRRLASRPAGSGSRENAPVKSCVRCVDNSYVRPGRNGTPNLLRSVPGVAVIVSWLATAAAASSALTGTVAVGEQPHREAVIWLEAHDAPRGGPRKALLSQRNLTFEPHVLAVRSGTTIELPNDDRVFHNVFSFHDGKRFDLGLYPVGTSKQLTFDQPGLSRIFCNIHPGMAAYVLSVDTPFFAVSDGQGRFVIPAVPPGTYTYHAWRAGGETLTGSVTVGTETRLDVRWP
jgi:plastocyanin